MLYAINPKSIDYILNSAYHMFPDSTAAKEKKGKDEAKGSGAKQKVATGTSTDEQANRQQLAFAYLMRGMHW